MNDDCPLCQSPARYLEHLKGDEKFCNGCGRTFVRDAEGKVVSVHRTQHEDRRPPTRPT